MKIIRLFDIQWDIDDEDEAGLPPVSSGGSKAATGGRNWAAGVKVS
jgi:hypothetical protein